MFDPAVFVLTEVRGRNRAANTIGIVLRSLVAFYLFLDSRGIDLDKRLSIGELLSLAEVEDLARLCRLPLNELAVLSGETEDIVPKVVSLEKVRMGAPGQSRSDVAPEVAASRLRYIRMYLHWMVAERLSRHGLDASVVARLNDSSRLVREAIDARIPRKRGHSALNQREGLSEDAVAELLRVIDPHSPDNPWNDQHARYRNILLIHWLLFLGVRIGEALGVRIDDIVIRQKEVTIHRRADDPDDPRRLQPQTKTRARVLPLNDALLLETQSYIHNHRGVLAGAKRHPFLFVASRTGHPMTMAAVGKLFKDLRDGCPSLPRTTSAHLLRHTWNDAFSKKMEEAGIAPEKEQQARSYLMGWSPTSDTAAVYTRRYVRNKAKEVSIELQNQLINRDQNDE